MGASIIRSDTLGSRIVRGMQVGAIFLLFVTGAEAAEVCERVTSERPKIGLVLGGGGARGSAHIGIIRVLEEMKVPVDYVAGTSIGSLVAALYATGMNADELESVILGLDWDDLFVDDTRRADQPYRRKRDDNLSLFGPKVGIRSDASLIPRGAIAGQKISFVFESLVKGRIRTSDFDELPIPYRAVAADLATGTQVVLSEGDLALAMRASMSVPGVFEPVEWDDYLLVDGGIVNNVPVDVVRRMGADLVIAVDVGSGLVPRDRLNNLVAVVGQLSNLMIKSNSDLQIGSLTGDDLLIVPPLGDEVSSAAFDKSAEGIAIGYAAADAQRDQIARLSVSEADYRRHRAAIQTCVSAPPTIQFVRLDNHSRFDDSVIMERVAIETGTPLDLERLDASVREIYALGFLSLARYEVVEEDGATGIILHIDQDDRGTEFLEWGFDFYSDGDDSAFNLLAGYLNTAVDDKGSELRVTGRIGEDPALLVDLYKYLEPRLKVYVNPMLFAERREVPLFEDGDPVLIPEVTQYGGSISIGREFGRMASVDVGVRVFTGDVEVKVGPPDQDGIDFDGGEYFVKGIYDRLDDRYFPGDGSLVSAQYLKSASWLGADDDYEQVIVDALIARSYGRHTAMGGVRYYETLSDTAPVYGLFRAGGFLRLSGLQQGEIVGQNFAMGLAGYRYHFAGSGLLPAYVGMTLEYGQVAADAGDLFNDGLFAGSLYVGYRSPVGPLYVGMALAQEGRQAFFLRIGNVFGNSTIGR